MVCEACSKQPSSAFASDHHRRSWRLLCTERYVSDNGLLESQSVATKCPNISTGSLKKRVCLADITLTVFETQNQRGGRGDDVFSQRGGPVRQGIASRPLHCVQIWASWLRLCFDNYFTKILHRRKHLFGHAGVGNCRWFSPSTGNSQCSSFFNPHSS